MIINGIVCDVIEGGTDDLSRYWRIEIKSVDDFFMQRYYYEKVELNNVVSGTVWLTMESID